MIEVALLLGGITVIALIRGEPEHMKEQRTYLFEDEDGEKENPFSDVEDGADAKGEGWKYPINRL